MRPPLSPDHADVIVQLTNPAYWLVSGLEWPGSDPAWAEAAVAISPGIIMRDGLSPGIREILARADRCAARHDMRVVFFSDLTRALTAAGTSWASLGVDWEAALAELRCGAHPLMFLTISARAHLHLCDSSARLIIYGPGGAEQASAGERDLVRQTIASRLAADWPPYIRGLLGAGSLRIAG